MLSILKCNQHGSNKTKMVLNLVLLCSLMLTAQLTLYAQNKIVSGTVTNSKNNQPLSGVSVEVQNKKIGTTSDINGKFSLTVPANANLVISYVGFTTQSISVNKATVFNIQLEETLKAMDEVVVIGYGSVKKKDLTGSVVQLRPDKIADQNPNIVQDILRGTPGVSVGLDPSAKGGGSILIRGQRSVYTDNNHNNPLIVLDGTIFYGEFSEINPDDIEQIDVLKDASATAVYGAKSANGVLIVTTKKGKKGKPKLNFTSNLGIATMGVTRDVMSPQQYLQYRQDWYTAPTYGLNAATGKYEAYQSSYKAQPGYFERPTAENLAKYGLTIDQWKAYTAASNGTASDDEIWAKRVVMGGNPLANFLAGRSFDWYQHSFRNGINQDYNISASGGSDQINYYMSLGYLSNQGIAQGNDYSAVRSNIKVESKIAKWLEMGANINFQKRTDGDLAVNWENQSRQNSPFASYKDSTGRLVVHPNGDNYNNNYGYNYDFDRQYRDLDKGFMVLNTILTSKVKLPFNITYSFNASPRFQFFHDRYWESANHPNWRGTNGLVNREQTQRYDWSLNNTINWEYTIAKVHRLNFTLVQEAEKRQFWQDRIEARNILPSDALGYHETYYGDKNFSSYNTDDVVETADGKLARLIYAYNDRYMLTTSVRNDGYSAFGTSNPRATFFSAALAWTFTREKFFNWEPLSHGKLRLSWGQNGNRSLGSPYLALANLGIGGGNTAGYIDGSGNLIQYRYLMMDRLANPRLSWEKTEALNTGLDFSFLRDRITGSFDYYITPTVDMIMSRSLPEFSGFGSIMTNLGKVENKGFEISMNAQIIKSKTFNWNTTFGFSKYKNTIKHLYYVYDDVFDASGKLIGTKERDDVGNSWFIGQPIGTIWNYRVTGIWQADELTEAAKYGQRPGDPKVANNYTADDKLNADGSTSPVYNNFDKEFLGQTEPPVMGSLRNDFSYKNLNFSINMYSYWGHKSLSTAYLNQDNGTSQITNQQNVFDKDYWTVDNPTTNVARLDAKAPNGLSAPNWFYDRSFIRLDNISLGYTLPTRLISKLSIDKLKVFSSVRNVAVWAKDKDWNFGDIETGGLAPRIFTFGLNVNF